MKKHLSLIVLVVLCLFWAGMIAGISFLEAPVKFTAPSLTLKAGLDVGRHVFGVFNKVELVLGLFLLAALITADVPMYFRWLCALPLLLMSVQSWWLLPELDKRVLLILSGGEPQPSSLHVWYVTTEALKLGLLLAAGFTGILQVAKKK